MKSENPTLKSSPNALEKWLLATRPKTWIASISPVILGASLAGWGHLSYPLFSLTLLFALLIQIGTNFANDYFDFMKGADTPARQGPQRAVQRGWISPTQMKQATTLTFSLAFLSAIPLMIQAGIWSLFLTALCILFGILYTGGKKPLGYMGFGDLLVLLFFGPIATLGTYFLQTHNLSFPVFLASLGPGLLSCALLVANNLRDEKTDREANKKTLIVRFGSLFGKLEYALCLTIPTLIPLALLFEGHGNLSLLSVFCLFPLSISLIKKAFQAQTGADFIPLLPGTSLFFFFYTLLFAFA